MQHPTSNRSSLRRTTPFVSVWHPAHVADSGGAQSIPELHRCLRARPVSRSVSIASASRRERAELRRRTSRVALTRAAVAVARRRAEVEVARRQAAAAAHRELLQGKEAGTQEEGPCLQAVPSPPEAPPPQEAEPCPLEAAEVSFPTGEVPSPVAVVAPFLVVAAALHQPMAEASFQVVVAYVGSPGASSQEAVAAHLPPMAAVAHRAVAALLPRPPMAAAAWRLAAAADEGRRQSRRRTPTSPKARSRRGQRHRRDPIGRQAGWAPHLVLP